MHLLQRGLVTALLLCTSPVLAGQAPRAPKTVVFLEPDPGLKPTTDGSCGNGLTCLGSKWGQCCSEHGYCGSTSDYCGSSCNPAFGTCDSLTGVPGQGVSSDSGQACRTTATETQTQTSYQLFKTTYTATETATSTVLLTKSTTFFDISFTTSVVTVTSAVTTIVPQASEQAPSPTFPGTTNNCKDWYRIRDDVKCGQITEFFGISKDELREWNPAMSRGEEGQEKDKCTVGAIDQLQQGLCRVTCKQLWAGYNLCVGV